MAGDVSETTSNVNISLSTEAGGLISHCQADVDNKITATSCDEGSCSWREDDSNLFVKKRGQFWFNGTTTFAITNKNEKYIRRLDHGVERISSSSSWMVEEKKARLAKCCGMVTVSVML